MVFHLIFSLCLLTHNSLIPTKRERDLTEIRKMTQIDVEKKSSQERKKMSPPPPPPPPPPPMLSSWTRPSAKTITRSVTKEEIAKFWRRKKMEEEDHLLAAIKAAARIRARNLTEEDYRRFEESLEDDKNDDKKDENKELRIGIKDWWTKSKYAYLNQPAIGSMDSATKRTSTYIPNFCFYKPPPPHPTSFGVF